MPKRDWAKDWELCQRATPEPWGHDFDFSTEPINGYIYRKYEGECGGPAIARVYHGAKDHYNDLLFIAEAREALPYWLQRVRELEKKLAKFEHFVMAFRKLRREKALASTCVQCALRQIRGDDYCSTHKDAVTAAEEELEQALKDLGEVDNHAKNS